MEGEDHLSSQPPGASLSECELADQDVGIADRLAAVIADILLLRDDSHVVSLILVSPRLRFLEPRSSLCRAEPAALCRSSERARQRPFEQAAALRAELACYGLIRFCLRGTGLIPTVAPSTDMLIGRIPARAEAKGSYYLRDGDNASWTCSQEGKPDLVVFSSKRQAPPGSLAPVP
jgi:hypothetical protein